MHLLLNDSAWREVPMESFRYLPNRDSASFPARPQESPQEVRWNKLTQARTLAILKNLCIPARTFGVRRRERRGCPSMASSGSDAEVRLERDQWHSFRMDVPIRRIFPGRSIIQDGNGSKNNDVKQHGDHAHGARHAMAGTGCKDWPCAVAVGGV